MGRKMTQAELSNSQNILGREDIYLVRYQLNSAEKILIMQKGHSIHAETFNRCVMFGENKFQLRSCCGMERPMVTLCVWHSTGHCCIAGAGDWAPTLAPQLSELAVLIASGTGVVTLEWQWKQAAAAPGLQNQLGMAQLDTSPRQTCNSVCKGLTDEGWRVNPSM